MLRCGEGHQFSQIVNAIHFVRKPATFSTGSVMLLKSPTHMLEVYYCLEQGRRETFLLKTVRRGSLYFD